jgi:hypothetical protein
MYCCSDRPISSRNSHYSQMFVDTASASKSVCWGGGGAYSTQYRVKWLKGIITHLISGTDCALS